ncbi:MAG: alpha/beta hydrolase [Gemmatimonadota bacterium]|jgi:predicted esterase|nr:alpha/beta hydrolase [Gemmatimonadota bacterium]
MQQGTRYRNTPHGGQPVVLAGEAPEDADAAMVMVHGRGATAASILTLADELGHPGWAYLAPQAAGFAWYPFSFLAPREQNEPGLSSGLAVVGDLVAELERRGIPPERTVLLGFSQGACLALEWAACNARRLGGVVGLSGGLIGPPGTPREYGGSLDGTPVFLGCSDRDPHIPRERVAETAEALSALGGDVTERIYPGMGHTVNEDEIHAVQRIMEAISTTRSGGPSIPR